MEEASEEEDSAKGTNLALCHICEKPFKSILQHLNKSLKCQGKMTFDQYESILEVSRQNKLDRDKRNRKRKLIEDPEKVKENARIRKANQRERIKEKKMKEKIEKEKKEILEIKAIKRRREFMVMSRYCLMYLSQGRTPPSFLIKNFSLVEYEENGGAASEEKHVKKEESRSWLKEIDSSFLEAVVSLQIIVLIPKSAWLTAIQTLEENQEEDEVKDRLYKLIGKLQAGENHNTKDISLPKAEFSISKVDWKEGMVNAFKTNKLTEEDETMLIDLIVDIIADEDGLIHKQFHKLLGISSDIENLYEELHYTVNRYEVGRTIGENEDSKEAV